MSGKTDNTIASALFSTARALDAVAQEEAARQARLLVCYALGTSFDSPLGARLNEIVPEAAQNKLADALSRRLAGEPVQYILGEWDFMGLTFYVTPDALIPRQDTETLCELALSLIRERRYRTCLDMCCGTGCIGISLNRISKIAVTLGDISPECLALAEKNAARHGAKVRTVQSDLFSKIRDGFDIITVNPPYISDADMNKLSAEVKREPELALAGGADGLDLYRRIAKGYKACLNEGGALLMECGAGQAGDIIGVFGGGYAAKDILGIERVVVIC